MGEMTRGEAIAALRRANPRAPLGHITVYVDAWLEYTAAQSNIAEHGTIVFHPRTGAPIPNPYLVVRDKASRVMAGSRLKTDVLWREVVSGT